MRYPTNGPRIQLWTRLFDTIIRSKDRLEISKSKVIIVGTVGAIMVAFYMTGIQPKINHEYYAKKQSELYSSLPLTRDQIAAASHLPPWRDPFDRESRKDKIPYGK